MTVSPSGALLERLFGGEETSPRPLSISTCVPELDRLSRILGETKCYMIASAETCRSVATSIKIKRPHTGNPLQELDAKGREPATLHIALIQQSAPGTPD
jgi:hypothetical protein